MKKIIFINLFFCSITLFAQENIEITPQTDEFLSNLSKLSPQEMSDKASFYLNNSSFDTAFIYCNLIINTTPKKADIEQQIILLLAYNRLGIVYGVMADFRLSYDNFIKALMIGEEYNLTDHISFLYTNIGNIYSSLNNFELAKQHHLKALNMSSDSIKIISILNNLGNIYLKKGDTDSAYYYLNQSIFLSKKNENNRMQYMLNNLATYYQKEKLYDSAFYCFRKSIEFSKINNDNRGESINFSEMGKLFFEINNIDSALYYIDLSNKIAYENKFLQIITDNYLILSEIEKSKGKYKNALELYETYTNLKDSLTNAGVYGSINLLQTQYENSKTNQQIEELIIDRQIKENTIRYQRIIQRIIASIMLLAILVLLIFISQNRKLRTAYKVLVDKNIEIIEFQKKIPETFPEITEENETEATNESKIEDKVAEKNQTCPLSIQEQNELLKRILIVMDDVSVICDKDFSLDKLVEMLESNQKYISYVVNRALNKNFRSFLNSYRIKEAQKLLSELNTKKFTVNSVAQSVGFESYSGFYYAFKEITGVSPNFYLKSVQGEGGIVVSG